MSRIDELFRKLRRENRKALMPFVTAGDPNLDFTAAVLQELDGRGCQLFEVGIPYSDPIADGPVIQASYTRALDAGISLEGILGMLSRTTPQLSAPCVTMVSYAILHRRGLDAYLDEAQQAGVAGAIVPDLPVEESALFAERCASRDFSLVQLVTPTTPRPRALRIAEASSGFLYYVSVAGITGERRELPPDLVENVAWLREQTDLPICIGFGISAPEHVRLLAPVADGLIVGSAIVRRLAESAETSPAEAVAGVGTYVAELLAELAKG